MPTLNRAQTIGEVCDQILEESKFMRGSTSFSGGIDVQEVDNKAEFMLAHRFNKYMTAGKNPQHEVPISTYSYWLDFLLEKNGLRVGVEVDGKAYHDKKRDAKRDKRIMRNSSINSIVRFEGADAYWNPSFCNLFLMRRYPHLFYTPYTKYSRFKPAELLQDKMQFEKRTASEQGLLIEDGVPTPEIEYELGYIVYTWQVRFISPEDERKLTDDQEKDPSMQKYDGPEDFAKPRKIEIRELKRPNI